MPKVSICLPVFNGEKYLRQAIESVLAQSHANFELLIADDCSTDSTAEVCSHYVELDSRIVYWRNSENLGLFANYNECMSRISGDYVKLFAQDDLLHPAIVAKQLRVLKENSNVSLVNCARTKIGSDGNSLSSQTALDKKCQQPYDGDTILPREQIIASVLRERINCLGEPSSMMFRSDCAALKFNTNFEQLGDLEYAFRILSNGDWYFISTPLCSFRVHSDGMSAFNNNRLSAHLEWLWLAEIYRESLPSAGLSETEYCRMFINDWTRNLESSLNANRSFANLWNEENLQAFCATGDILSDIPMTKFHLLSVLALLKSTELEHELRLVHDAIAAPFAELDILEFESSSVRQGISQALSGVVGTLRTQDAEIADLRKQINEMGQSLSWKLTEPVRAVRALVSTLLRTVK